MKCVHGRDVGGFYGGECWECEQDKRRHREIVEVREQTSPRNVGSSIFDNIDSIEKFFAWLGMVIGALAGGIFGLVEGFKAGGVIWALGFAVVSAMVGALAGALLGAIIGGLLPLLVLGLLVYAVLRLLGML